MKWETVKIESVSKGRNLAYASVGFGRIGLSVAACELLGNYQKYCKVQLLEGQLNNKKCIGIKFLKNDEAEENTLPIKRKTSNGKVVGGLDIACKGVLEKLFGPAASASKITRYNIKKDPEADNILIIYAE